MGLRPYFLQGMLCHPCPWIDRCLSSWVCERGVCDSSRATVPLCFNCGFPMQIGETALHYATRSAVKTGSIEIVQLLLERGADINTQNKVTRGDMYGLAFGSHRNDWSSMQPPIRQLRSHPKQCDASHPTSLSVSQIHTPSLTYSLFALLLIRQDKRCSTMQHVTCGVLRWCRFYWNIIRRLTFGTRSRGTVRRGCVYMSRVA